MGKLRRCEIAQVPTSSTVAYLRLPLPAMQAHALQPCHVVGLGASVSDVLSFRADPEIAAPVIQLVAIDVADLPATSAKMVFIMMVFSNGRW